VSLAQQVFEARRARRAKDGGWYVVEDMQA
jgi:hypothetical protein